MTSLTTASLEEIREVAARICRDYLTGQWKHIKVDDIQVKRISGGLSNFLYHVSLPEDGSTINAAARQERFKSLSSGGVESSSGQHNSATIISDHLAGSDRKRNRTDSGELVVAPTSGGVHSSQWEQPHEVLLRIYGQTHGENALETMITETVVFALLSERNLGPKLHGIFPGGRIEQYIPARALTTAELSDHRISMKIAEKMGEIHSLNIPMSKEPDWLWNCMERWLKSISGILDESTRKHNGPELEEVRSVDFRQEIKWLKSVVQRGCYPVVFCHNDLQEGNILLREAEATSFSSTQSSLCGPETSFDDSAIVSPEDVDMLEIEPNGNTLDAASPEDGCRNLLNNDNGNKLSPADIDNTRDSFLSNSSEDCGPDLIIIDFEYCAYNYRGFDLANHFLEWTLDYSNPQFPYYYHRAHQYPTKQQRYDFIISYLKRLNDNKECYVASMDQVLAVDKEVQIFSMFSHFFWSLWSVVNTTSNIEFGYWNYALTRIREYKQLKQEYLKNCT